MVTRSANSTANGGLQLRWWNIVLHLVWIGMLGTGVYFALSSWKLASQGQTTTGTVVDMIESSDSDGVSYAPVVEYEAGSAHYRYQSSNYSYPPAYQVGQQVKMVYESDHPDKARISSFFELWFLPLMLIPFGLISGAVSLFVTPILRRRAA